MKYYVLEIHKHEPKVFRISVHETEHAIVAFPASPGFVVALQSVDATAFREQLGAYLSLVGIT